MELETSEAEYPGAGGDGQIPIDLFGSKKHAGVPRGVLAFADASGNIVYRVNRQPPNNPDPSQKHKKLLLDSSGNTLFSIYRNHSGSWKCYKGDSIGEAELVFRVQRTLKKLNRVELEVYFGGERSMDEACDLRVRGSPFRRSCSIYKSTDLVAQTSLMYKLHQIYASRGKFRITIFPGTIDHALIVALFVIFLNGRK